MNQSHNITMNKFIIEFSLINSKEVYNILHQTLKSKYCINPGNTYFSETVLSDQRNSSGVLVLQVVNVGSSFLLRKVTSKQKLKQ